MDSEMLMCDFRAFRDHYLPFCPAEKDVNSALALLVQRGVLSLNAKGKYVWTEFYDTPSQMSQKEDDIFRQIENVTEVLLDYEMEGRSANFAYRSCPNTYMKSDIEGSNFKVDGRFELAGVIPGEVSTTNAAVIAEYKKREKDVFQNRKQLLSAANHVMNDDPRRTAVYGITIEDDKMSLWYFSRSHSAKSEEFNFMQEPRYMILRFLSLMFATDGEIGYDPNILHVKYKDKFCYVYKVGKRYFRTEQDIFSCRSLCITGRMTRVWKAIEVQNKKQLNPISATASPVAIKDVWLEQNAKTEHEIQEEVFEDIRQKLQRGSILDDPRFSHLYRPLKEEMESSLAGESYKRHFMSIVCSELGAASKQKSPNATPVTGLFDKDTKLKPDLTRAYTPKQHYLVVYSEVGTPLDDAPDLLTACEAIKDTIIALLLLYLAGWVHRDISTGNILYFKNNGVVRAKLSDLEYSKRFGDTGGGSDPKTGTPHFMAVEIAFGLSLYHSLSGKTTDEAGDSALQTLVRRGQDRREHKPVQKQDQLVMTVYYNYQHDLESLWWIAVWFLLYRVEHEDSNSLAAGIFRDYITPSDARMKFFIEPDNLEINVHPDLVAFLEDCLVVSKAFYTTYIRRGEAHGSRIVLDEDYTLLHSNLWVMLSNTIEVLEMLKAQDKLPPLREEYTATSPSESSAIKPSSSKRRSSTRKRVDDKEYAPTGSGSKKRRLIKLPTKRSGRKLN